MSPVEISASKHFVPSCRVNANRYASSRRLASSHDSTRKL
jgi:hypothetical protein